MHVDRAVLKSELEDKERLLALLLAEPDAETQSAFIQKMQKRINELKLQTSVPDTADQDVYKEAADRFQVVRKQADSAKARVSKLQDAAVEAQRRVTLAHAAVKAEEEILAKLDEEANQLTEKLTLLGSERGIPETEEVVEEADMEVDDPIATLQQAMQEQAAMFEAALKAQTAPVEGDASSSSAGTQTAMDDAQGKSKGHF